MTREQDFERRLAEWLEDGPVTAPTEVVDRALERTDGRRQRRGPWRWLPLPAGLIERWFPTPRLARAIALAAVLAGVLLTSVVISVPFVGGPGAAPEMDDTAIRAIAGVARVTDETDSGGRLERTLEVDVGDPRVDGEAVQVLQFALVTEDGMSFARGRMRLENAWGTWEGPLDITTHPSGEQFERASLAGTRAYEGFTYLYTVHHQPPEAERAVEGAIWPDEPPLLPDPSLLP